LSLLMIILRLIICKFNPSICVNFDALTRVVGV
jgi:hypothetical protein